MKTFRLDAEIASQTTNIDWWGFKIRTIGPDAVSKFLSGCSDGEKVKIEINSPGGSVIAGLAIANAIKNSKAHVIAHIVGIAASMASVVACACDEIQMEEGAFMMIHNPWGVSEGDADDMRHTAMTLDQMRDAMMAFYRAKFPSRSGDDLKSLMSAEIWMCGEECVKQGLACTIVPTSVRAAACVTRHHFQSIPAAAAKFLDMKVRPPEGNPNSPAKGEMPASPAPAETSPQGAGAAPQASEPTEPVQTPEDWESRYKGASKKLNELQEQHKAALADIEAKNKAAIADIEAKHQAAIKDLNGQLDALRGDLEKAKADLSSAVTRAETAEKDLAAKGEQLDRLNKAHALLTGGVLSPGDGDNAEAEYQKSLNAAGSAEKREEIRKQHYARAKAKKTSK